MGQLDDSELLRRYVESQSDEAFAALVTRHINLVYSVALRQTGSCENAEEIAQAVFIILAGKAKQLRHEKALSSWLFQATRLTAANLLRSESRRLNREQEAYMQSTLSDADDDTWAKIAPLLDSAVASLREKDRRAILLLFYEGRNLQEVGMVLGASENAACKRVSRALDKLRLYFSRRGINSTTAIIGDNISAHSVQVAPATLAKAVAAVAVAKGVATSASTLTLVKGTLKIMAWEKAQVVVIGVAVVVVATGIAGGVYYAAKPGPAAELQAALNVERPKTGNWQYTTEKVFLAIHDFGTNRAAAFPILERAIHGTNDEARKQAIAALQLVGRSARPPWITGEPSPDAVPLLWQILNDNENDLGDFALSSLRGIGFQPKDIPVLAGLLVRSHGDWFQPDSNPFQRVGRLLVYASDAQRQSADNDMNLRMYLPEAIAETIRRNPEASAPFTSSVESLLGNNNPSIQFGAACALAEFKGVDDPRIAAELKTGLKGGPYGSPSDESLEPLMAIETLQRVGPSAKSLVPALLDYAKSATDDLLRELAFRAAGEIDSSLRNTIPEVDQAVKNDPAFQATNSAQ